MELPAPPAQAPAGPDALGASALDQVAPGPAAAGGPAALASSPPRATDFHVTWPDMWASMSDEMRLHILGACECLPPQDFYHIRGDRWFRCQACRRYVAGHELPAPPCPPGSPGPDAGSSPDPPAGGPGGGGGPQPSPGPDAGGGGTAARSADTAPADTGGAAAPAGVSWNQHVEAHAPPPPPPQHLPDINRGGAPEVRADWLGSWFVMDDISALPLGDAIWSLAWSGRCLGSKLTFLPTRVPMVSEFLQRVCGNNYWHCPLCARLSDVDMEHFIQLKHIKQVWHALDQANARMGMSAGTYTDLAYGFGKLWMFTRCQPSLQGNFTAAVSLMDGQCFLLAQGGPSDFVAQNGWVTFLCSGAPPGSVPPSRMSAAAPPLTLKYGPARAG